MKILILLLVLVVTTASAKADEVTQDLEQLVRLNTNFEVELTRIQFEIFLKKQHVRRPEFYAKLIASKPISHRKKKVMAAILVAESRGDSNAVSGEGATGPWQIMPRWKRVLKVKGSLKDPVINFQVACQVYDIHAKGLNERDAISGYSGNTRGYADKILRLVAQI